MLTYIVFVVGLALLTYTLFSYEDEEKKLKNWLDEAWLKLYAIDNSFSKRLLTFLRVLLNGLNLVLAKLYGREVFSFRAFASSVCLCTGIAIALFLYEDMLDFNIWIGIILVSGFLLTPYLITGPMLYVVSALLLSVAAYLTFDSFDGRDTPIGRLDGMEWLRQFGLAVALASVVDFLSISSSRKLLLLATDTDVLRKCLAYIALTIAAPIAFIVFQIVVSEYIENEELSTAVGFLFMFNLAALLLSAAFFIVLFASVVTRIMAAILPRAIYATVKLKLFENRKSCLGLGILFIGLQFPQATGIMERIAKVLTG